MCRNVSIAGKAPCWAFVIGCALVFAALLTLAHARRGGDRALAQESYARVLDTVTRLADLPHDPCPSGARGSPRCAD